jgi:hypothetical protein
MRKLLGIVLCSVAPVWFVLLELQERLLDAGILNKKDMPPIVGKETGTVAEYFLNVWHWDAMLFLLALAAIPCLIVGVTILWNGRGRKKPM